MRKIAHYWKIKCPTCGAETISSAQEGTKAKCSHFNRFLPEESLVLYYNDLGEEVAVRLDSVGQICYSFSCPLCKEKIEACATAVSYTHLDVYKRQFINSSRIRGLVDKINGLSPDIVFLVGDIVDESISAAAEEGLAEELKRIKAPLGIYACLLYTSRCV